MSQSKEIFHPVSRGSTLSFTTGLTDPSLCLLRSVLCLGALLIAGCLPSDDAAPRTEQEGSSRSEESTSRKVSSPIPIEPAYATFGESETHEAPSLSRRVLVGELPPLSERLPDEPLVVKPISEPGKYGGTLRRALVADIIDRTAISKTLNENLVGYDRPLGRRIQLNLAASYEFQDEGRTAIFNLRKGTRWSDGTLFTVDDILFWYEDVALDEEARNDPFFPSRWLNAGRPVRLEKVDDWTLKITSHKPLGTILETLCFDELALPKHHFAQYHPRYNKNATYAGFRDRTTHAQLVFTPGTPSLSAWVPVAWNRGRRALFERNPYYWKIDTAGNQLPYIDQLEFSVIPNTEVILLKFLNGELDLIGRYFVPTAYQILKEKEREGRFTVYQIESLPSLALFLNWDAPQAELREAFRNIDVRKALSYGINRAEIGAITSPGGFQPTGISFSPTSPFYSPETEVQYSRYDPEYAQILLDHAGYRDRDGDNYREFPDGSRFEITIDAFSKTSIPDIAALIVEHWAKIGIKAHLNIALQEIIVPRRINGTFEITITNPPTNPLYQPEKFSAVSPTEPFWHRNAQIEGQPWMKEITRLISEARTTLDPDRRLLLVDRIRDLQVENLPFITLGSAGGIWAASNRIGNAPRLINVESITRGWDRAQYSEQLYFRQ